MRHKLQLAAALLTGLSLAHTHAQISSPDIIVSKPPRPPQQRRPPNGDTDTGKLQWLWQYTKPEPNGNAAALRFDERFGALLDRTLRQPQAMWGKDVPIALIVPRFLARYGNVTVESERYFTVDGCVPSFCPAHGLLWIDLGSPHPLVVFIAVDWTTEGKATDEHGADFNLWLFPSRELSADAIPVALATSLSHWDARLAAAHRLVPHIAHAILVQPSGQPAALDPAQVGMNTLPPQPDTVTPKEPDTE